MKIIEKINPPMDPQTAVPQRPPTLFPVDLSGKLLLFFYFFCPIGLNNENILRGTDFNCALRVHK